MGSWNARRIGYALALLLTLALPLGLIGYKLFVLDYPLDALIPAVSYQVEINMEVAGHGDDITVSTYLPKSDSRQTVSKEANFADTFALSLETVGENRLATWSGENITGRRQIRYTLSAQPHNIRYEISPELRLPGPEDLPPDFEAYLRPEPGIQVRDPSIQEALQRILPQGRLTMLDVLQRIHRHLQDNLKNKDFSGFTDALTALKLGEGSCNGKGRLFVAMARSLNIPARLVGGLILEQGSKRVSHQWVEIHVNGHWVPFDTINDHFAEVPANFLTLYYGDLGLFRHTSNVNFQYFFKMSRRLVPKPEAEQSANTSFLNLFHIFAVFERIGISQNLLKIILMIPIGALVTIIFRNVIGLETFGTFLPALIAAAARETGLLWGLVGFVLIIILVSLVRMVLDWLQLLHSPKMGIILTTVVILMLTLTILGVRFNLFEFAHVTLFPIAVLAITAERFALVQTEQGLAKALRIMAATLVVIAACYVVMDSLFLQSLVLAFQEVLLVVIALNLWLGKWIGMRVTEFYRFRRLIFTARSA